MKDQQSVNKGLLAAIRVTNSRIDLLGQMCATHLSILRIMAGVAGAEEKLADSARLQKQMDAATAEVNELTRMLGLDPDGGADPGADPVKGSSN
jgi:hypothetical protein